MTNEDAVTTREYIIMLLGEYRSAHAREHQLLDVAMAKAEATMNMRLEGMNELRTQITSERGQYATRDMLRPFQQFMDRWIGVLLGFTALNAIITGLVVKLLSK